MGKCTRDACDGLGMVRFRSRSDDGVVSSCRVSHRMFQVPRQRQFTDSRLLSGRSNPIIQIVDTMAERILFSPPRRRVLLIAY
jgi:hypothetical protein